MDETMYTVILADGTRLENLTLNGNNFVSNVPISETIFEGNTVPTIISDGIHPERHEFMELVQVTEYEGKYLFVLRDVPESELVLQKMNSDIQYLSMMSGIDLF